MSDTKPPSDQSQSAEVAAAAEVKAEALASAEVAAKVDTGLADDTGPETNVESDQDTSPSLALEPGADADPDPDAEPDADPDPDAEPEIPEALERVYDAVRHGPQGRTSAAFFDLDKTILAKSSTMAFAKEFVEVGLIRRSDAARTAYAQLIFMLSGADHDQMEKAKLFMSDLVTGWPIAQVREVVAETLDSIVDPIIYSEAMELFELHREAGHDIVIISSSGTEVVEPIGERLGADIVLGTKMAVEDGKYTGEILFYAYGDTKAEAMQTLADENGYDLEECFAYTDSYTDLPMLKVVGHATATNPDSDLRSEAEEQGWDIVNFSTPVAIRARLEKKEGRAVAAVALGSAVALGLAWYARHRSAHQAG